MSIPKEDGYLNSGIALSRNISQQFKLKAKTRELYGLNTMGISCRSLATSQGIYGVATSPVDLISNS